MSTTDKIRTKLLRMIYKSDLLIIFLFIISFGVFFHFLTWLYEPPDLMTKPISDGEGRRLIEEWKRSRLERNNVELVGENVGMVNHIELVQGPNTKRKSEIYGEVPVVDMVGRHKQADHSNIHDMADLKRLEDNLKRLANNSNKNEVNKIELYENIRKLLAETGEVDPENFDIQTVIRKYKDQENIKSLLKKEHSREQTNESLDNRDQGLNNQLLASNNTVIKTNQTALKHAIDDTDNESNNLLHTKPAENDNWLDERAEELFKEMFNQKPKRKSPTLKPTPSNTINVNRHEESDVINAAQIQHDLIAAPIGGKLQGGRAQCVPYDVTTPINETFECVPLDVKPKVVVCLYPSDVDIHISRHIRQENIWEAHIVKEFQNILFANPNYGVIDIGANIGIYSLIAASMNHSVVAVEPFINNIRHFHQAVYIGGFGDRITLVRNAVNDQRRNYMSLQLDQTNQGGIRMDPERKDPCLADTCTNTVKAVLMDDLLEVINFRKAVIKIDIEGYEHRAFIHSAKLFSQVTITHIIMEWRKMREYYGTDMDQSEDKDLVFELVALLYERGFRPFSLVTNVELKRGYWYGWPDDIIWKNELADFVA